MHTRITMTTSTETTSAADMQEELRYLRQRNGDLQSQVEKLLKNQRELAVNSHKECGENSIDSAPSSLNAGLGHRKTDEIIEQPMKLDRSDSSLSSDNLQSGLHHRHVFPMDNSRVDRSSSGSSSASKRRLSAKSMASGPGRKLVISEPGSHLDLVTSPAHGSSAEAGFENDRRRIQDPVGKILRGRLKKKISNDGSSGRDLHALSIDRGDEEEATSSDAHIEVGLDDYDDVTDEELDNLIDDDSHNKHLPKDAIPGSTPSNPIPSPRLFAFPPFKDQLKERAGWLIGLLVLQSCSSFIIQHNQRFLQ
jgi:hypothetical protein